MTINSSNKIGLRNEFQQQQQRNFQCPVANKATASGGNRPELISPGCKIPQQQRQHTYWGEQYCPQKSSIKRSTSTAIQKHQHTVGPTDCDSPKQNTNNDLNSSSNAPFNKQQQQKRLWGGEPAETVPPTAANALRRHIVLRSAAALVVQG
jgi:hypothetical protein